MVCYHQNMIRITLGLTESNALFEYVDDHYKYNILLHFHGRQTCPKNDGQWEYVGGRSKSIHIYKGMSFEEFTQRVLEKFNISLDVMRMHSMMKISVITDISVLWFYGYIGDILADILEENIDKPKID